MAFEGTKYRNDFNKQKYDRYSLMLPKGKKEQLEQFCQEEKIRSINSLINAAIDEYIKNYEIQKLKKEYQETKSILYANICGLCYENEISLKNLTTKYQISEEEIYCIKYDKKMDQIRKAEICINIIDEFNLSSTESLLSGNLHDKLRKAIIQNK